MSADYIQANTDGRLHDATEPSISPLNRGFLYGDAIYEVWRTYDGVIFAWDEHWQRLERSARALAMPLPFTQAECLEQIRRTAQAFAAKTGARPELYIRLQVTRGAGAIGLNPALADQPGYVFLIQSLKTPSPEQRRAGLQLGLARELHRNPIQALNPAWKTGNYLNNILCLREVTARGADEVVMTNLAGEITESAVSNIFFVRDGVLCTPPLGAGILEGITRAMILRDLAPRAGCRTSEAPIPAGDLRTFQECFISGTTREIMPVRAIDDIAYRVGPDTLTARLQAVFAEHVQAVVRQRPDLRVW
jgi:branched-chain amino acid aminotransferase